MEIEDNLQEGGDLEAAVVAETAAEEEEISEESLVREEVQARDAPVMGEAEEQKELAANINL